MPQDDDTPIEVTLQEVKQHLKEKEIKYPFVIKVLKASRTKYSHSFFVVSKEEGIREALEYEGFKGEHLVI